MSKRVVITGAFSYTGAAVAREMRRRGWSVHTLTNRQRPEGMEHITSAPLRFEAGQLKRELEGADAFVITFWVRLPAQGQDFTTAVQGCAMLTEAAVAAGVPRLVYISVSNAQAGTNLGYYHGKAKVESIVRSHGISHAIVRPTLVVGPNDVLTNNIAWFLRRFPVFLMPGGGKYRLQPITLDDTARIIADATESTEIIEIDAAGPEVMTFEEYVRLLAQACGLSPMILGMPNRITLGAIRIIERFLGDIALTREELLGLQQELLLSHQPGLGRESVSKWLLNNGGALGTRYVNDMHRHFGTGAAMPILGQANTLDTPNDI